MTSASIPRLIDKTRELIQALRQIGPEVDIRGETQGAMTKKLERYHDINGTMAGINAQTTTLMNERNELLAYFRKLPVSAREVVAGRYGKDSTEYELVGGKRTSERSRSGRKKGSKKGSSSTSTDS